MSEPKKQSQFKRIRIFKPFRFTPVRVIRVPIKSTTTFKKLITPDESRPKKDSSANRPCSASLVEDKPLTNEAKSSTHIDKNTALAQFDADTNPYAFFVAQIPTMLGSLPSEVMCTHSQNPLSDEVTSQVNSDEPTDEPNLQSTHLLQRKRSTSQSKATLPLTAMTSFGVPKLDCQKVRYGGSERLIKPSLNLKCDISIEYLTDNFQINKGELYFWLSSEKEVLTSLLRASNDEIANLLEGAINMQALTFAHLLNSYQQGKLIKHINWPVEELIVRLTNKNLREQISLQTLTKLAKYAKPHEYALIQYTEGAEQSCIFSALHRWSGPEKHTQHLPKSHVNNAQKQVFYTPCKLDRKWLNTQLKSHQKKWQAMLSHKLITAIDLSD